MPHDYPDPSILQSFHAPEWRFPGLVALAVLLVIVSYRLACGAGFGWIDAYPDDSIPLGIVHNEHDNLMYLSWIKQAAEGQWRFADRYTLEDHDPIFMNPFFLLVGWKARLLGWPPQCVLILFGLMAIPIGVGAGYGIARQVGLSVAAARWAVVLIAFSSGITYPLQWVWPMAGGTFPEELIGADQRYLDALFFPTFLVYPYITVAYAVMALTVMTAYWCDEPNLPVPVRCGRLSLLAVLIIVLGFTHPYEHLMISLAWTGFVIWTGLLPETRPALRRRVEIMATMAVGSGIVLSYFLWLARQPVWDHVAAASSHIPFDPIIWITGWGTLLPLAFFGAARAARDPRLERTRWPVAWLAAVILLLIVLRRPETKVSAGSQLPLCILAGSALAALAGRVGQIALPVGRRLAMAGFVVLVGSLFGSTVGLLVDLHDRIPRVSVGLLQLGKIMPPDSRVLCDYRAADYLVPLAGVRVYCGNHYKTPDWRAKTIRQALAGIDPDIDADRLEPANRRRTLRELLHEQRIDFIVVQQAAPAYTDIETIPNVSLLARQGEWFLYQVRQQLSRDPKESANR